MTGWIVGALSIVAAIVGVLALLAIIAGVVIKAAGWFFKGID